MKWIQVDIDSADWDEFNRFHQYHNIRFKTIYDCDYEILVLMLVNYVFRWVSYISLGEGLENHV